MTDDKLVEAIARAINHVGFEDDSFDREPHHVKLALTLQARAAIEAMRVYMMDDGK